MKILAIRGCNLASLAGEFEIDLAHGPLGAAGVFAIVGNTGAGKSTLLDALCVALFDRTPRLTNHSRVVIGRDDDDPGALGAQDVRTLLRRGAASGWAEVDFESGDERRYRARWSVRRARGHSDGTIQAQQVSLTELESGEPSIHRLGGTKTETLAAIQARLGLTFDQFRRSALLAQGEFAAFLRADGKDRSELLERMTGTEIYSRLSVRAHEKAMLAEQLLRDGRAAALAIPVLEDEARRATELEHAAAEQATAAARARLAAAETAARWVAEAAKCEQALIGAQTAHAAAIAAVTAAEPERAELAVRRRAELLRAPWEDTARLERQHGVARAEVTSAGEAAQHAVGALAAIGARRTALAALHAPVREARISAGIVERAATPLAPGAIDVLAQGALADASWLTARIALGTEVAGWSELETRYAQHATLGDAITALDRTLRDHAEARGKLVAGRGTLVLDQQGAVARLAEAQRRAEAFARKRGLTLDAAAKQEDQARKHLIEVERLVSIAAGAREAVKAQLELERQLAELDELAVSEAAQHRALSEARIAAAAVRIERVRIVDELRRAAGYEHARAELRAGEECPLCGATEHPWADRGAFDDVIAASERSLAEIIGELETIATQLATLHARAHQRDRERARLDKLRTMAVTSATAAFGTWREHLAALGELLLVDDPALPAAEKLAHERETTARKRLEEARNVRAQTEAAVKAVADAQAAVQTCQADVEQMTARLTELDRKVAELDTTIERQRGERAGRAERHAELAAELDAAIARWIAAVPAADAPRPSLTPAARRTWMAELAATWQLRAERVGRADAALAAALTSIDHELRVAERGVAEHATRLAEAERRLAELTAELAGATATLDAARAGSGFELAELRSLLSADPSRLDVLAERLAVLDRAVDTAAAVVRERRRMVDDHAAARPTAAAPADSLAAARDRLAAADPLAGAPDPLAGAADPLAGAPDPLADAARVPAIAAALAEAERSAARLAATLAADAEARRRRDEALALVAIAEGEANVDRILGEVIGSHDGKLFRSFAQSLTLDGLLAVANAHLEELAPRYQLERVPKHDLELQVIDRDLGHEVRSVQSLSGGESFLVSLALALGLSSMSAHDVRVRTLLIDEGFGTLDPATLDSALSVLDALQARGRQVGVISHVPQLVERVGAHVRVVQRGGGRSEVIVS